MCVSLGSSRQTGPAVETKLTQDVALQLGLKAQRAAGVLCAVCSVQVCGAGTRTQVRLVSIDH